MILSVPRECNTCENYQDLLNKTLFFKDVSQQIMEKKPLGILLKDIMDGSKTLLNAEASSLLLFDAPSKKLFFTIAEGEKGTLLKSNAVELGQGFAGWVALHQKSLKIDDCYADDRFNPDFDKKTGFRTKNMLCTPMIRKGELIGVIQVINKIGASAFNNDDVSFFNALAAQCAIAIENARLVEIELESEHLSAELNTARKIQQKTLPSGLPEIPSADVHFSLTPAKHLGGDYYNVVRINESSCLFMIADVSGKSVSAALIVASVYSFLHTYLIVNKNDFDLKDFVESLNKFLMASTTSDKFVTAWFGLLDEKNKTLQSISAGHDPTYFYENGNAPLHKIENGGLLLGMMNMPYQTESFQLKSGDTFVVYTDGITEAMNEQQEEYGTERFQHIIEQYLGKTSKSMIDAVVNDIISYRGAESQSDDITMGVIRIL
jgi:sigma-B regulation protein RsbU (phosphoserine phosphatase)